MIYSRFYDHVLTEIEAGNVHDGINMLVGMLDTVGLQAQTMAQATRELHRHSLNAMLLEDPLIAHAKAKPDATGDRVRLIGHTADGAEMSSTGRRIAAVTGELSFARAIRQRHACAVQKLSRAHRQGLSIALISTEGQAMVVELNSADVSAISVIKPNAAIPTFQHFASTHTRYDLILGPDLLDTSTTPQNAKLLQLMARCLSEQGSIIVAALLPQHLGAGWLNACLNWKPQWHDEATLQTLGQSAGLAVRAYRDESDCIIWAELKHAPIGKFMGGHNHVN